MRGAAVLTFYVYLLSNISTHAPHARRGTQYMELQNIVNHFYSRASCEARRVGGVAAPTVVIISTHAPHARRGYVRKHAVASIKIFLLTRLMRGAANNEIIAGHTRLISTHAPHARRGVVKFNFEQATFEISTHAPHARRGRSQPRQCMLPRISTHAPHARRGGNFRRNGGKHGISTHAPHARRGMLQDGGNGLAINFYSRASCEARQRWLENWVFRTAFLLTRLMRGAAT